jgi:glutamyl-tRNA synthetase
MTVEALRQFMLAQGPSQAVVSLEWDSIWSLNKKIIDPIAPRFWAINKKNIVPVIVKGGPSTAETKNLPKHKKNAEIGDKTTVFSSQLFVEQDDALSFDDDEEVSYHFISSSYHIDMPLHQVTFMDWGNAFIRKKVLGSDGQIESIEAELHLDGDFRKTKKKVTWLSQPSEEHKLIDTVLLDYDYIITKKKLEEDDKMEDFVTPVTEFREQALADANIVDLKKGDIIQFERKGYYIFDGVVDGAYEFIHIPDGRAAGLASKAVVEAPKKTSSKPAASVPTQEPETKMYKVTTVYGESLAPAADINMYQVKNVYEA